jgi:hypothetical protein
MNKIEKLFEQAGAWADEHYPMGKYGELNWMIARRAYFNGCVNTMKDGQFI